MLTFNTKGGSRSGIGETCEQLERVTREMHAKARSIMVGRPKKFGPLPPRHINSASKIRDSA